MINLPQWPQKANDLRKVQGIRRRILKDLSLLNQLCGNAGVPTRERSALQVLEELERVTREMPSYSPTYQRGRNERV